MLPIFFVLKKGENSGGLRDEDNLSVYFEKSVRVQIVCKPMALPTTYESVGPVATSRPARSRVARVVAGSAVILFAAACVAFAGQATEQAPAELIANDVHPMHSLAMDFLKHGQLMSVTQIQTQLDDFTKNPGAQLQFPARTMMLAGSSPSIVSTDGQALVGETF